MMFEKQSKSGIDKLKAPSSDLENPSALSLDAIKDSPGKGEEEASKPDHGKSGTNRSNANTTLEEGSQKQSMSAQQEVSEDKAPEKSEPDTGESSSHPPKRPRTDEHASN